MQIVQKFLEPKLSSFADHKNVCSTQRTSRCNQRSSTNMAIFQEGFIDNSVEDAKLQLAACMACHCAISTIGHIAADISAHGKGSPLEYL